MERFRDMQLFAALAGQPSLAAAARAAQVSGPTLIRAVARLEARLAAEPGDAEGWRMLGRSRAALGENQAAIEAYRQMIALIGEKDPTTRRLLETILNDEEEHADEMADLLKS